MSDLSALPASSVELVAERMLFMLAIYPGYRVDSRGPSGCILDVLDVVAPEIATRLRAGEDAQDLHDAMVGA